MSECQVARRDRSGTIPSGKSPFLLRTTASALSEAAGRNVRELRRVGKRIAIGLDGDLWPVLHLMIAGRLHWKPAHAALLGRQNLAAFDFPPGSLPLTEAGSKPRASLHVVVVLVESRPFPAPGRRLAPHAR